MRMSTRSTIKSMSDAIEPGDLPGVLAHRRWIPRHIDRANHSLPDTLPIVVRALHMHRIDRIERRVLPHSQARIRSHASQLDEILLPGRDVDVVLMFLVEVS